MRPLWLLLLFLNAPILQSNVLRQVKAQELFLSLNPDPDLSVLRTYTFLRIIIILIPAVGFVLLPAMVYLIIYELAKSGQATKPRNY